MPKKRDNNFKTIFIIFIGREYVKKPCVNKFKNVLFNSIQIINTCKEPLWVILKI